MVNFDEIEFLESEIVEDDPNAPVGTLIRVLEDGTVEEIKPVETVNQEEITTDIQEEQEPIAVQEETTADVAIEHSSEQVEETAGEPIAQEAQLEPIVVENVEEATQENAPVIEEQDVSQEAPIVQEQDEQIAEEPAVEPIVEQAAQVEPIVNEEVQEKEEVVQEAPKKPTRRPPVKRKSATAEKAVAEEPTQASKTSSLNLSSEQNVNAALFDTNFEIQEPQKAKVVSTKKKQEKAEDLWAVASVTPTAKKTSKTKAVKEEAQEEVQAEQAPAPKKRATKKSTQVEDTNQTTTEEKKVAKASEKTTAKAETKATKAEPQAKEEKVAKTKAAKKEEPEKEPVVKEEKAPKTSAKAHDNDETVIVEGEGKMHGKYVIKKTDKGNFVFKLYSSNYRVVAIGAQAYTTLGAAKIGVQSVINNAENAPVENQTLKNYETLKFPKWEIYLDKKGEYRLRLFATNGNLIATTNDGYADISGAKNGIAAVARASKGCSIVRNDNLW